MIEGGQIVNIFSEFLKEKSAQTGIPYNELSKSFWKSKALQTEWKKYKNSLIKEIFVPRGMPVPFTRISEVPSPVPVQKPPSPKRRGRPPKKPIMPPQLEVTPRASIRPSLKSFNEPTADWTDIEALSSLPPYLQEDALEEEMIEPAKPALAPIRPNFLSELQTKTKDRPAFEEPKMTQPKTEGSLIQEIQRKALERQKRGTTIEPKKYEKEMSPMQKEMLEKLAERERKRKMVEDEVEGSGFSHLLKKIAGMKNRIIEGEGMYKVQSVLFNRNKWDDPNKASKWLKSHSYKDVGVDIKEDTYRFRQLNPSYVKSKGFKQFVTKPLGKSGVSLILAYK